MNMKIFAAAIALSMSTPARADDGAEVCVQIERLAGKVMESRQVGVPMSRVMEIVSKGTATALILQRMVIEAYQEPDYSTEEYKSRQRIEFAARWAAICYEARMK